MTKTLFSTKEILGEGSNFIVKYYLCEGQSAVSKLYGICLEKHIFNNIDDAETIFPLSECKDTVENFINAMAEGDVTPVNLVFHVDDFMSCS